MPSTIINGVNLYYECHGEGEPLMLIAGLASDSRSWLPVVEPLSRRFLLSLCLVIPWGGVALDCAIRCPERVSRLILAATSAISCKRNNALLYDWFRYVESGMKPEYWFRNLFYWILSEDFFADEKRVEDAVQNAIADPYA